MAGVDERVGDASAGEPAVLVSALGWLAGLLQPARAASTVATAMTRLALTTRTVCRDDQQRGYQLPRSVAFKISSASGSPTSLISATSVRPCAYSISSLG